MKIQHSNLIFTNCGRRVRALYQSSHSEQIKSGPGDHKKYSDKGESRKGWRERPLVVIYSTRSCPPRQDAVCVCVANPARTCGGSVTAICYPPPPPPPTLISIYYAVPSSQWISAFVLLKNSVYQRYNQNHKLKQVPTYTKTPNNINSRYYSIDNVIDPIYICKILPTKSYIEEY